MGISGPCTQRVDGGRGLTVRMLSVDSILAISDLLVQYLRQQFLKKFVLNGPGGMLARPETASGYRSLSLAASKPELVMATPVAMMRA
jgi:hypothetical protein